MFIVSYKKTSKNKNKYKPLFYQESLLDFYPKEECPDSPKKYGKKNSASIDSSFQTNYTLISNKGGSLTSSQEKNFSDEINDSSMRNEFLGKKTNFFRVNYITKAEEQNSDIGKKKPKKNKTFTFTEKIMNEGRWNEEENLRFLEGIYNYGNEWKDVKNYVRTRTSNQVRSHAQKFILKIKNFKDESLGIDFTDKIIKNLNDIIVVIKEAKEKYQNENILAQLSQKLSEKYSKNSGTSENLGLNNTDKKLINNKEEKIIEKKKEQNISNNENEDAIIDDTKDKKKPEIVIDNIDIKEEKTEIEKKEKEKEKNKDDNNNKREILENDKLYFEWDNKNNENIDMNNLEILNGIAIEVNDYYFNPFNKYNSIEINTISIINNGFFC